MFLSGGMGLDDVSKEGRAQRAPCYCAPVSLLVCILVDLKK